MSISSNSDLFLKKVEEYQRGMSYVRFTRFDDQMRRLTLYSIIFEVHLYYSHGPDRQVMDDLIRIYDLVQCGSAYIVGIAQDRDRTTIELELPDHMAFNPPGGMSLGPPRHYRNPPPQFTFTDPKPEPKKPKKITIVKKIQTKVEIGYRDFVYLKKGNQSRPILLSRNGVPWPKYEALVASCNGDPFVVHDAPSVGCQCGIYAYNKPDNPQLKADAAIWGEIALWGKVLICPDGFRAEYAYPQNIFMKDVGTKTVRAFAAQIEKEYGVPVHLVKERTGTVASVVMAEMIAELLKGK
jgi:hypothetical protein